MLVNTIPVAVEHVRDIIGLFLYFGDLSILVRFSLILTVQSDSPYNLVPTSIRVAKEVAPCNRHCKRQQNGQFGSGMSNAL
jgi:hypothetical protein